MRQYYQDLENDTSFGCMLTLGRIGTSGVNRIWAMFTQISIYTVHEKPVNILSKGIHVSLQMVRENCHFTQMKGIDI